MTIPIMPSKWSWLGAAGQAAGNIGTALTEQDRYRENIARQNVAQVLQLVQLGVLPREWLEMPEMQQAMSAVGMPTIQRGTTTPSFEAQRERAVASPTLSPDQRQLAFGIAPKEDIGLGREAARAGIGLTQAQTGGAQATTEGTRVGTARAREQLKREQVFTPIVNQAANAAMGFMETDPQFKRDAAEALMDIGSIVNARVSASAYDRAGERTQLSNAFQALHNPINLAIRAADDTMAQWARNRTNSQAMFGKTPEEYEQENPMPDRVELMNQAVTTVALNLYGPGTEANLPQDEAVKKYFAEYRRTMGEVVGGTTTASGVSTSGMLEPGRSQVIQRLVDTVREQAGNDPAVLEREKQAARAVLGDDELELFWFDFLWGNTAQPDTTRNE